MASIADCWCEFYGQREAFTAYQALGESDDRRLFAFQRSAKSMLYVLAQPRLVGEVVLGLRRVPGSRSAFTLARHCFEHFGFHDQPMVLFADAEYSTALNPTHEARSTLNALIRFVRLACRELLAANNIADAKILANQLHILVETCHRPSKVSFHLKLPQLIVEDMAAQRAFWSRVFSLINAQQQQGDAEALLLVVQAQYGENCIATSFLDPSVYQKKSGQLLRTLASAKNDAADGVYHYLVPEGRERESITLDQWLESLVLRPSAENGVEVPASWYPQRTRSSPDLRPSLHFDASSTDLQQVASAVLQYIDEQWQVAPTNIKIKHHPASDASLLDLSSSAAPFSCFKTSFFILAPSRPFYCPLKRGHHDSNAACVVVTARQPDHQSTEGWCDYRVHCKSGSHPVDKGVRAILPQRLAAAFLEYSIK